MLTVSVVSLASAAILLLNLYSDSLNNRGHDELDGTIFDIIVDKDEVNKHIDKHVARAAVSSVQIYGLVCGFLGQGSGFAVADGNVVVTSAHVVTGMRDPTVRLADGRELPGEVVAYDLVNDLALLHVRGASLESLHLIDEVDEIDEGTTAFVLGWEHQPNFDPSDFPNPMSFRLNRSALVRVHAEGETSKTGATSKTKVERNSWLLDGKVDVGYSGAALVVVEGNRVGVIGVVWGVSSVIPTDSSRDSSKTDSSTNVEYSANGVQTTSSAQTKGVSYATQISELKKLLSSVDINGDIAADVDITANDGNAGISSDNEIGGSVPGGSGRGNRC